jgi:23S rRNA U2552 (ribose-2'-O)-methylase RlmE/FtsJ
MAKKDIKPIVKKTTDLPVDHEKKEVRSQVIPLEKTQVLTVVEKPDLAPEPALELVPHAYTPLIVKLPHVSKSIFDNEPDPKFSINMDYPSFKNGFQHFIHANKEKMKEIAGTFENKKKVYTVINPFERYVNDYTDSIGNVSKTFFGTGKDIPDILSRGFYKLWEILMMFDLIDLSKDKFVSAHLAEGPGSFIQATMFFRDHYGKKGVSKNDKYYGVTLHPEDTGSHVPELEKNFVEYYKNEKPNRFILHKTYSKELSGGAANLDDGDLTNPKTIKLVGGQMGEKADFITADGGFEWKNENTQEQEAFRLIYGQIMGALKLQKKGGNFVCKFFETYTNVSLKFISFVREFYKNTYFIKPLTSRSSNSEKYLVCVDFKYDDKDSKYKSMITKLEKIFNELHKNKDLNIVDIFPDYFVSNDLIKAITYVNIEIANVQFKQINEIKKFVDDQNYFGDVYQLKREYQIQANKYWISAYLPEVNKFKEVTEKLDRIKSFAEKKNNDKMEKLPF